MSDILGYGEGFEDSAAVFMARVLGSDGTALQQADVTGITCKVFDLDSASPTTAVASPTIVVASVIYDTLQTSDVRWTKDSTGYNFLHAMPPSAFPTGGHRYRVEYLCDPASGDDFFLAFDHYVVAVLTS